MLNNICIGGRLAKDPELRYTKNQIPVVSFSIACDEDIKNDGERKTIFVNCIAWRGTAEYVSNYIRKGDLVAISGRLGFNEWEKDGIKHKDAEIKVESIYRMTSKPKEQTFEEVEDDGECPF